MKIPKYQQYLLLTLVITIGLIGFYSLLAQFDQQDYKGYSFASIFFTLIVSINIILVNFPLFDWIEKRFPLDKRFISSIIIGFLITSTTAAIIITIWVLIFYFSVDSYYANCNAKDYGIGYVIFTNIVTAVVVNIFIGAGVVIRYSTIEWKKAAVEAEKFKRESIESQYATLINQINPHFLFNSLNALVSLIPQSPEKAVEFVNKFSKIYRYVLDAKDKIICEIKEELDFADSYCFLQKIRFGDNLIIDKRIESCCLNQFLPPLSLQLLIENAIKHNEISKANPLKVKIYTQQDFVFVENTIRQKSVSNEASGIGLKNLTERYKHLSDKKPEFYIENQVYIAKIPIIAED